MNEDGDEEAPPLTSHPSREGSPMWCLRAIPALPLSSLVKMQWYGGSWILLLQPALRLGAVSLNVHSLGTAACHLQRGQGWMQSRKNRGSLPRSCPHLTRNTLWDNKGRFKYADSIQGSVCKVSRCSGWQILKPQVSISLDLEDFSQLRIPTSGPTTNPVTAGGMTPLCWGFV